MGLDLRMTPNYEDFRCTCCHEPCNVTDGQSGLVQRYAATYCCQQVMEVCVQETCADTIVHA